MILDEYKILIKDPNIKLDSNKIEECHYKGRLSLFYYGILSYIPSSCPHCHCPNQHHSIVKNGTRSSKITLAPVSGLPAYLILKKQRFLCRHCSQSFTANSSLVQSHCSISNGVKRLIMDRSARVTNESEIAHNFFVSTHTVRRIIDHMALTLSTKPSRGLPNHLCFDEFKSVASAKGAMSFICCDALSHQLVDIVENRRKGL